MVSTIGALSPPNRAPAPRTCMDRRNRPERPARHCARSNEKRDRRRKSGAGTKCLMGGTHGAGDEIRTHDPDLGKVTLPGFQRFRLMSADAVSASLATLCHSVSFPQKLAVGRRTIAVVL